MALKKNINNTEYKISLLTHFTSYFKTLLDAYCFTFIDSRQLAWFLPQ